VQKVKINFLEIVIVIHIYSQITPDAKKRQQPIGAADRKTCDAQTGRSTKLRSHERLGLTGVLTRLRWRCGVSDYRERAFYNRLIILLAGSVMSVDPDLMMMVVTPGPMSRNPAPVSSTGPVARTMDVIRPISYVDTNTNRIGGRGKSAHAKQRGKK
jgi:hypothetical protein